MSLLRSLLYLVLALLISRFELSNSNVVGNSENALLGKLEEPIIVSIVACGSPYSKYVSMLKRLLLSIALNKEKHEHYKVYIFFDPKDLPSNETAPWLLCPYNSSQISLLLNKLRYRHKMHVKLTPIPTNISRITSVVYGKPIDSLSLFKKCATLKLWLPDLLANERAVINLDTDMLVMESLRELWGALDSFPTQAIFGLAEELYYGMSWYDYHRRYKAGRHGVNSGTLLFDLAKARKYNTTKLFVDILTESPPPSDFGLGDQDVLNVALFRVPELYTPLHCRWNRRLEGCIMIEDLALSPGILHGNREVLYAKEDWTDSLSVLHRAAFTMYSNLLTQDGAWCVPVSDATPGAKCADLQYQSPNVTFYRDGDVFRGVSSREVYIIHSGLRHLFPDSNAFIRLGLEWSVVKVIPDYMLNSIPLGYDVGNFSFQYF